MVCRGASRYGSMSHPGLFQCRKRTPQRLLRFVLEEEGMVAGGRHPLLLQRATARRAVWAMVAAKKFGMTRAVS